MIARMKPALPILISLAALLLLVGCTSTRDTGSTSKDTTNGKSTSEAPVGLVPGPDYAVINFIRPSIMGFAVPFGVWDGETGIGLLTATRNLQYKAAPGDHIFMIKSENWGVMKATVEAGKTYTILVEARMGLLRAQVHMEVIKPNDKHLASLIKDAKLNNTTEADRVKFENDGKEAARKAVTNVNSGEAKFDTMNPEDGR